jgi:site-specific DNA-cytosine methylase
MICKDLAECGYTVWWNVINCADYGVPQNRIRVILLGSRNDLAVMASDGGLQYHIGGEAGPITHPAWYVERYKIALEERESTHDSPKGK